MTASMLMRQGLREEFRFLGRQALPPRRRTMREFLEQTLVLPSGPAVGHRFNCRRQPFAGLYFAEWDSRRYQESVIIGCVQSGKTLMGTTGPVLYHLFEIGESVVYGVPTGSMAWDKWTKDIRPAIEKSPYAHLLPQDGVGSRGGKFTAVHFRNGTDLRFMTGYGKDEARSGYTARVVIITEADKFDERGATSRETDKIQQLEARTRAFGERALVYKECTPSFPDGHIWKRFQAGTASVIHCPCPHCRQFVVVEREHLVGWQTAVDEEEARTSGHFVCPSCGHAIADAERVEMNRRGVLVHRGQSIETSADGRAVISGDRPRTRTLGFRWNAFNNLFDTPGLIALEEWRAARATDGDAAERKMRQFVWALPWNPPRANINVLDPLGIARRVTNVDRGIVPQDTEALIVGIDIGKYVCWWHAQAFRKDGGSQVIGYGRLETGARELGVERGTLAALRSFRDQFCEPGWPRGHAGGERLKPHAVLVDSRYQGEKTDSQYIYDFCQESSVGGWRDWRYRPTQGLGSTSSPGQSYRAPEKVHGDICALGDRWYIKVLPYRGQALFVLTFDADHYKSQVHQRLSEPLTAPTAMALYAAGPMEHVELGRHYVSERQFEDFKAGKGLQLRWDRLHRMNHWLDGAALCFVGAGLFGIRAAKAEPVPAAAPSAAPAGVSSLRLSDGRAFLVTERSL